jgi:geranylgeranyl diphosphate synthase type II
MTNRHTRRFFHWKGAKHKLDVHIKEAKRLISGLSLQKDLLYELCDLIAARDH